MVDYDELISRTNSIIVLKMVGANPGIGQRAIIDGDGRNSKLKRLNEMVDAKLIEERTISNGRIVKTYYLTPEGKRICHLLSGMNDGEDLRPMDCGSPSEEGDTVKSD